MKKFLVSLLLVCGVMGGLKASNPYGFDYERSSYAGLNNEKVLIKAARDGDEAKVQALIKAGANVDVVESKYGETALHEAVFRGHENIVKMLLEAGAQVDAKNEYGSTPLFDAAYGGKEVAQILLDAGADVNAQRKRGITPLMYVIGRMITGRSSQQQKRVGRALPTMKLLLERGANPNIKDNDGDSAWIYALDLDTGSRERVLLLMTRKKYEKPVLTIAALTAAVIGFMKFRSYQATKKRLAKKYKLGNLTNLQDKVWLATKLASYHVPWWLNKLVRDNIGKDLTTLTGKDPHALAELYYGHAPSQEELDAFIAKFFSGVSK